MIVPLVASSSDLLPLTVILPVYNGARFLRASLESAWAFLVELDHESQLLVVDDCSTDATADILAEFGAGLPATERPRFTVLHNDHNRGKGYSVRRGAMAAIGERILFTDADLTYPIENLKPLIDELDAGADIVYGSRMHAESRYVVAPTYFGKLFSRHLSGRIFNLIVRSLAVPGILDTQAGLKGFRRDAIRSIAPRIRLDRFSFDVELLFAARRQGLRSEPAPVRFLYRKEPSTVRFVRDSLSMLFDIARIRWWGFRGVYDAAPETRDQVAVPTLFAGSSQGTGPGAARRSTGG